MPFTLLTLFATQRQQVSVPFAVSNWGCALSSHSHAWQIFWLNFVEPAPHGCKIITDYVITHGGYDEFFCTLFTAMYKSTGVLEIDVVKTLHTVTSITTSLLTPSGPFVPTNPSLGVTVQKHSLNALKAETSSSCKLFQCLLLTDCTVHIKITM